MRRWIILFLACVFVTALNTHHVFAEQNPVAVITNYNTANLRGRITIIRAAGNPYDIDEVLYPNDKITGDINEVQLDLAPYTACQSYNDECIIKYNPPSQIRIIGDSLVDSFKGWFKKNVEPLKPGVSCGVESSSIPQPATGLRRNHTVQSERNIFLVATYRQNLFDNGRQRK